MCVKSLISHVVFKFWTMIVVQILITRQVLVSNSDGLDNIAPGNKLVTYATGRTSRTWHGIDTLNEIYTFTCCFVFYTKQHRIWKYRWSALALVAESWKYSQICIIYNHLIDINYGIADSSIPSVNLHLLKCCVWHEMICELLSTHPLYFLSSFSSTWCVCHCVKWYPGG